MPVFDINHVCNSRLKGGLEPLEKEINEILGSRREDRLSDPFLNWYEILVWFVFRSCFAFAISVRTRGTCESSRRSARRQPGVEGTPFIHTTSDRLDTWLIPSAMTRSRQYYESTMVWRNIPLYQLLKCLLPLCHDLFVEKGKTKYQKQCNRGTLRQTIADS